MRYSVSREIKVLIVDDSAIVRQTISSILSKEKDIRIIGTAPDPYFAVEKINNELPDVIILDIEMPKMDGLTFLSKIMTQHPIPVIICSTLTQEGSDSAIKAVSYGAVDIITKPKIGTKQFLEESGILLIDSVRAASVAKVKAISRPNMFHDVSYKLNSDAVIKKKAILTETTDSRRCVHRRYRSPERLS
jgi:two-component system chemotaxis response regulator CheB